MSSLNVWSAPRPKVRPLLRSSHPSATSPLTEVIEMRHITVRRGLCAAALSISLSACSVGPNYSRPEMPSPAQYRFIEGAAQAESLANAPWWQVFDDPALQALIRDAITNNLDLRIAIARVEEAR